MSRVTRGQVREIWSCSADVELIAPLLTKYPNYRKVGSTQSYFFSSWLSIIAAGTVYDFIDYCDQELTGEELHTAIKAEILGGFLGGQQFTQAQGDLMQAYYISTLPPEAFE